MALERNLPAIGEAAHRHVGSEADGLHAGERAHPRLELAIESGGARLVVAGLVRVHRDVEYVAGIEPEIEGLNFLQAADEKSGDDQQSE
jgi:hypothetical protein